MKDKIKLRRLKYLANKEKEKELIDFLEWKNKNIFKYWVSNKDIARMYLKQKEK